MIAEQIRKIHEELPGGVSLVAVSKFHPVEALMEAYEAGQRIFGESRVQELLEKIPQMPDDVRWHFIGHLQTNKVRQVVGRVSLIESVDSERLLEIIDRESEKAGVTTRVLMQVHVAREETKFGFMPDELLSFFSSRGYEKLKATHLCGVMGMASNTDDADQVRRDFAEVFSLYGRIVADNPDLRGFATVSMGMSGDWRLAIEEGSTMVRIGSMIFGSRQY